ncbi:hypothetical protein [Komagataeibacter swingsii]|nr:hypothetical protein [Komagataeibacter swingsii]
MAGTNAAMAVNHRQTTQLSLEYIDFDPTIPTKKNQNLMTMVHI